MAAYFSFRKLITPYFVKTIYTIGFAALTAAGIGWGVWAGMRLSLATLPTRVGVYYIAISVGILLAGNLVWRLICEFWLLLFSVHDLLASIEKEVRYEGIQHSPKQEAIKGEVSPNNVLPERRTLKVAPSRSVLGLSS